MALEKFIFQTEWKFNATLEKEKNETKTQQHAAYKRIESYDNSFFFYLNRAGINAEKRFSFLAHGKDARGWASSFLHVIS